MHFYDHNKNNLTNRLNHGVRIIFPAMAIDLKKIRRRKSLKR